MSQTHNHGGHSVKGRSKLLIAMAIVLVIMVVEVIGGILSNSLALVGDAIHMLVDALALGLALFAITIAARPATPQKTFGYYRVEIMAALINGVVLVVVSLFIFYEAYQRSLNAEEIKAPLMLAVSGIGLVANLIGIFFLQGVSKGNLNIKAAFWHIVGDTISSVGVIAAALIILFTGWRYADSIIAVVIGCIILWGALKLVKESVDILMEAVPGHINSASVIEEMKKIPGVQDVHDVHIWSITSGINSLSAHILIQDQMVSMNEGTIKTINDLLNDKFAIVHTTLQVECNACSSGPVCGLVGLNREG